MRIDGQAAAYRLERARTRSRFAGLLQKSIVAVVALVIVGSGLWVLAPNRADQPVVQKQQPEFPTQVAATGAEITGVDRDTLPFTIKASKSVQDKKLADVVHLEVVDSTFARPAGKIYAVTSDRATYNDKTRFLSLQGQVRITDQARMVATMDGAEVDTNTRSFISTTPVFVQLENGTVTADQLVSKNDGERLVFKGRVKAIYKN